MSDDRKNNPNYDPDQDLPIYDPRYWAWAAGAAEQIRKAGIPSSSAPTRESHAGEIPQ